MSDASNRQSAKIARIWRGRTLPEKADAYQAYIYETGIKVLAVRALDVQMFREDRSLESEFVVISYWEDEAAMSRYAGPQARQIHHLSRDAEFLIDLPSAVQVLRIVVADGDLGMRSKPDEASSSALSG